MLALVPTPIGVGPRFQPPALRRGGAPVGSLRCVSGGARFRVHLELFAAGRAVIVPAGVGVAAGCSYPVRTRTPTGVLEVRGRRTLGDLFRIWGRALGPRRLLSFRGPVRVYVAGRRRRVDPRALRLPPGGEVVVEVGPYVPPHRAYVFPR